MTAIEQILNLARAYVQAQDSKKYSTAQSYLAQLASAVRTLPSWMEAAPVEPAAEVERTLAEHQRYRVANEDGHVVLIVTDGDDAVAGVMTESQAATLRADLARVMAAVGKAA